MPTLLPAPNCLRCQLHWQIGGDTNGLSRFFINFSGTPPNQTQATAFASSVASAAQSAFPTLYDTITILTGATIQDLTTASGFTGTAATTTQGTRTGNALSAGTAVVVNHHIQRRYRGGKPRVYLPFGVGTDLTGSKTWASAFTTAVLTAWNTFMGNVLGAAWSGGTGLQAVSLSYYAGFKAAPNPITGRYHNYPLPRPDGPVIDVILANSVNTLVGSQRRRNRAA